MDAGGSPRTAASSTGTPRPRDLELRDSGTTSDFVHPLGPALRAALAEAMPSRSRWIWQRGLAMRGATTIPKVLDSKAAANFLPITGAPKILLSVDVTLRGLWCVLRRRG